MSHWRQSHVIHCRSNICCKLTTELLTTGVVNNYNIQTERLFWTKPNQKKIIPNRRVFSKDQTETEPKFKKSIFGRLNHLGTEPGTETYSAWARYGGRVVWVPGESWGSKQAHCVIHQPVSMVSRCGAGAWLYGLVSGDQCRLTGSGSTSEECSRWCTIQIYRYFTLDYILGKNGNLCY